MLLEASAGIPIIRVFSGEGGAYKWPKAFSLNYSNIIVHGKGPEKGNISVELKMHSSATIIIKLSTEKLKNEKCLQR